MTTPAERVRALLALPLSLGLREDEVVQAAVKFSVGTSEYGPTERVTLSDLQALLTQANAAQQVADAVNIAGPNRQLHERIATRVADAWPTLWRAVHACREAVKP